MSPAQPDVPISMRGVSYAFGTGPARTQVLFDVNLEVERGSLTVLMGPSGSGKTTLLTLIGCLREIQEGSVSIMGTELKDATSEARVLARRQLGFIFQAHNLHNSLTATQNVVMGLQVLGLGLRAEHTDAARHVLGLVGLQERIDYLPAALSGGQKQRVAVARALVANPAIILADEPTAALDKDSSKQVVSILKRLGQRRGTTTVVVTHDNRILDFADRIIELEDGRVVG